MNTHYLRQMVYEIGRALETTNNADDRPALEKLLSLSGYLLAKIELDKEVRYSISNFERHLSNLWIENEGQYNTIFDHWKLFKGEIARELSGMTVNERMSVLGLMQDFDKFKSEKDRDAVRHVLNELLLPQEDVDQIIQEVVP